MPSNVFDYRRVGDRARNLSRVASARVSATFRTRFLAAKCVGR
jgi:hypothetical protein